MLERTNVCGGSQTSQAPGRAREGGRFYGTLGFSTDPALWAHVHVSFYYSPAPAGYSPHSFGPLGQCELLKDRWMWGFKYSRAADLAALAKSDMMRPNYE